MIAAALAPAVRARKLKDMTPGSPIMLLETGSVTATVAATAAQQVSQEQIGAACQQAAEQPRAADPDAH